MAVIVSAVALQTERSAATSKIPTLLESARFSTRQSNQSSAGVYNDPVVHVHRQKVSSPMPAAMEEEPAQNALKNNNSVSVPEKSTNPEYPVSRTITVMATGYSSGPGAVTFTGTIPHWGEVAVDPRFIPLGTLMEIPEFPGTVFRAEDTGGLVKGYHIDIWFYTIPEALQWGVKYIKVRLLGNS